MKIKVTVSKEIGKRGERCTYTATFVVKDAEPFGTRIVLAHKGNPFSEGVIHKGERGCCWNDTAKIMSFSLDDLSQRIDQSVENLREACETERQFQTSLPELPEPVVYII